MKLQIELLSDTLISSNDKPLAIYDNDIIYDELGLPYIPGKRIKGVLRESALEILEIYNLSNIQDFSDPFHKLFGKKGTLESNLIIDNLYIKDYEKTKENILFYMQKEPELFNPENIINSYTNIKFQTKINNNGVAENHSLRTSRVLKKGLIFEGYITIIDTDNLSEKFLDLAILNMRRIGLKRNRGFGKIKSILIKGENYENN